MVVEVGHRLFRAQNISTEGMMLKNKCIQFVLDGIVRRVAVHGHFFQDHLPLPFNLLFWEGGVEGDVIEQFSSLAVVVFQDRCIETDLFLGGVGV